MGIFNKDKEGKEEQVSSVLKRTVVEATYDLQGLTKDEMQIIVDGVRDQSQTRHPYYHLTPSTKELKAESLLKKLTV